MGFPVSWNFLRVGIDLPAIEVRFERRGQLKQVPRKFGRS
jgi:hypothetical protein